MRDRRICEKCGQTKDAKSFYSPDNNICRSCSMTKEPQSIVESQTDVAKNEEVNIKSEDRLYLDFKKYPELFQRLLTVAKKEFRPLEYQAIYFIAQGIGTVEQSVEGEQNRAV